MDREIRFLTRFPKAHAITSRMRTEVPGVRNEKVSVQVIIVSLTGDPQTDAHQFRVPGLLRGRVCLHYLLLRRPLPPRNHWMRPRHALPLPLCRVFLMWGEDGLGRVSGKAETVVLLRIGALRWCPVCLRAALQIWTERGVSVWNPGPFQFWSRLVLRPWFLSLTYQLTHNTILKLTCAGASTQEHKICGDCVDSTETTQASLRNKHLRCGAP